MKDTDKKQEPQRRNGVTRLSSQLPALTKTAFRNTLGGRGFAEAGLITEWASIVGNDVARMSRCLLYTSDAADE